MDKRTTSCDHWCTPKNTASLYCQQCNSFFCKECDQKMHQGRRQKHSRQKKSKAHRSNGEEVDTGGTVSSHLLMDGNEELMVNLIVLCLICDMQFSAEMNLLVCSFLCLLVQPHISDNMRLETKISQVCTWL